MQQFDYYRWFLFLVTGTLLCGALINKVGYYVPWYFAGDVLSFIGSAPFRTVKVETGVGAIYGYSVLVGLGSGIYVQAGYPIAQLKVDPGIRPDHRHHTRLDHVQQHLSRGSNR